ncbi:MAG: hypothetical protein RLO21_00870, partial [Nitratireductor sp.]
MGTRLSDRRDNAQAIRVFPFFKLSFQNLMAAGSHRHFFHLTDNLSYRGAAAPERGQAMSHIRMSEPLTSIA